MTNRYTYKAPCSEEELYDLYVNQRLTQHQVAKKLNTTQHVIFRAMRKMGLTARVARKMNQKGEKIQVGKAEEFYLRPNRTENI